MFEKRPDGASRRQTRVDKERKEKRKVRIMAISIAAALVLLFSGAMFINSNLIRRTLPALSIGSVNFSAVEFDYNFLSAVNEYQSYYTQMLGDYASDYLPSTDTPFSEQVQNEETGETWADYFSEMAIQKMSSAVQIYTASRADNFVMPDDAVAALDNEIALIKQQAEWYGYPSLERFLTQMYGTSLNERSLRKILEFSYIVSSYSKHKYDSFEYTAQELAQHYYENADTLDIFAFRGFMVNAAYVDDYEYPTDEEYQIAFEAALANAGDRAAAIAANIENEDDFIAAAKEYDEITYEEPGSTLAHYMGGDLIYEPFGEWMLDASRVKGDVTTADASSGEGTYVVLFVERDKNEYQTGRLRQIYIAPESINPDDFQEGEEDTAYITALLTATSEASARAEAVYSEFKAGGATEEKFLELVPEHSDNSTEGGLFEKIAKYTLFPEIDEWLFAPERKYGDHELFESESGFHVVFFLGLGERNCDVLADSALRDIDYQAWTESLPPVEAVRRWAFTLIRRQ